MIDPNMQRYFQRIYGAKPSPEILKSRPERKPPKRRTVFVNRLYEDSTKSPSLIFEDTFKRDYTRRSQGERRGSSLPESSRSSGLSRKIDDFLNSVVIQEKEKNEHLRGSTRSLSSSAPTKRSVSSSCSSRRRRRMDYPLPDLSKVKSTLLGSKHYQGPKGRSNRSSSSDRHPPPRIHTHTLSTDNDSSQDSAYAGESSRQHTPVGRNHRFRRRPSMNLHHEYGGDERGSQFELSTYLKYLNEVTTDILAQGAYSPKSLNKILESRFLQYEKETSRREALDMMAKLKKDLGISSNFTPQKETSRSREHLSSAGGSRRKRRPVRPSSNTFLGENTNLYRSRSCDDVLDIYSDKELFNLLKKDAGLDKKLADDVIRVVRGRSEENLCHSSYTRTKKKQSTPKNKTSPRNESGQQEQEEDNEEDLYNDEEFEKSESSEEEVKEEVAGSSEDE